MIDRRNDPARQPNLIRPIVAPIQSPNASERPNPLIRDGEPQYGGVPRVTTDIQRRLRAARELKHEPEHDVERRLQRDEPDDTPVLDEDVLLELLNDDGLVDEMPDGPLASDISTAIERVRGTLNRSSAHDLLQQPWLQEVLDQPQLQRDTRQPEDPNSTEASFAEFRREILLRLRRVLAD